MQLQTDEIKFPTNFTRFYVTCAHVQAALRPHGCFESDEELNHRMDVLRCPHSLRIIRNIFQATTPIMYFSFSRLNDIVRKWIKETSISKVSEK